MNWLTPSFGSKSGAQAPWPLGTPPWVSSLLLPQCVSPLTLRHRDALGRPPVEPSPNQLGAARTLPRRRRPDVGSSRCLRAELCPVRLRRHVSDNAEFGRSTPPQALVDQLLRHFSVITSTELGPDDDYFELGLVNSLRALEIVAYLEHTFGFEVDIEDLDLDNFRTVNRAAAFVDRKQHALPARRASGE
ncbi:acyl carrier protein [Nocardia cyriacigeorgica]|nr:acyl carrier protein [Nocardia cyriacigeorgica]